MACFFFSLKKKLKFRLYILNQRYSKINILIINMRDKASFYFYSKVFKQIRK